MTVQQVIRDHPLKPAEAAKYQEIREQVAAELPELIDRHTERMAARDELRALLKELRAAREVRGLSLADVTRLTGMDRSAVSKLENGQRPNPTMDTLVRYAEAVGKHLVISLADG